MKPTPGILDQLTNISIMVGGLKLQADVMLRRLEEWAEAQTDDVKQIATDPVEALRDGAIFLEQCKAGLDRIAEHYSGLVRQVPNKE